MQKGTCLLIANLTYLLFNYRQAFVLLLWLKVFCSVARKSIHKNIMHWEQDGIDRLGQIRRFSVRFQIEFVSHLPGRVCAVDRNTRVRI